MIFAIIKRVGEVAEWLKAHDSKSCMRLSRIGGSNPPLSAKQRIPQKLRDSLLTDFACVVTEAFILWRMLARSG